MEDDLYISATRAAALVENITAYLTGDPVEDADWDDMTLRLQAIQRELIRLLDDNDMPTPSSATTWDEPNPYVVA